MFEDSDDGAGQSYPEDQRGVIQLVADNEAALRDEARQIERIGGESHAECDGVLGSHEAGDAILQLLMNGHGTCDE